MQDVGGLFLHPMDYSAVLTKKNTTLLIKLIYDIIQFEIQLPYVVAVDEMPVLNLVVTIVLVVGVVAVISAIQLDIELTYYL